MNYQRLSGLSSFLSLCVVVSLPLWLLQSCHPKIYDFTATPRNIGPHDNILVNWHVRGTPTLLIHDTPHPGQNATATLRELSLVVRKHGHEISEKIQVAVLPDEFTDKIVFETSLKGDTLVAAGDNSAVRWGDAFLIHTVRPASNRPIIINHEGHTVGLAPSAKPATAFEGTAVKGQWEFRSLLTPAEKADHTLLPAKLEIFITVKHK